MPGTTLEIRLLGPLEVRRGTQALELPPSRTARALLAYLAATARPHAREHLCALLWEGPADPRGALRSALSRLRPLVDGDGTSRLTAHAELVAFEASGAAIDLALVQDVGAHLLDADVTALDAAACRFRGAFLDGLDLSRCHRFDTWCHAQRASAHRLQDRILAALVERMGDEPERALHYARQRVVLDPCAEDAHRAVVQLLAELGRPREAIESFETCRRILKRELGTEPSPELDALRRALLPARPLRSREATRVSPPPVPLVGRAAERRVIDGLVAGGATHALLLICGEPGIGKTRLLAELGARIRQAGGTVLPGRAFEAEGVRPYGPWIDALRGIETDAIPIALRAELAPLLPELGAGSQDPTDRSRLFEAVAVLLARTCEAAPPLAIVIDDVQWLDDASAALLHFLSRRLAGTPVVLACAGRPADITDNEAVARLLRALRRDHALRLVELEPLDADETAALVRRVDAQLDAQRIFAESEGNPLFALELARSGLSTSHALPATLAGLIDDRLARFDADARRILQWAAALGHDFSLDLLARLTDLGRPGLLQAVEQLEQHGVLEAAGSSYDFTHDLIRRAAYQRITLPRRQLIHRHIARVLHESDDTGGERSVLVAHHAALGGEPELAARACLEAARRALWAFAPTEAAELTARGIDQLEGLPAATRLALHLELLGLSILPGMRRHRIPDLEAKLLRLVSEARAAGLHAEVYRGLQIIAYVHFLAGDFGGARERALLAQEAGRGGDPATVVRALGDAARCLGIIERDMPRAQRLAEEADRLAQSAGYEGHELPQALGYVHHHNGTLDDAIAAFERAAFHAHREHERWFECISLSRIVMIELERRRPAAALSRCRELVAVTSNLGEGSDAAFAEALQALAARRMAEPDADARLHRALAALRDADSRWMIAYVQNLAARIELEQNRPDAARWRAKEALESAELVDRRNEIAVARALLAALALHAQDRAGALHHLDAVQSDLRVDGLLSARARRALQTTADALSTAAP